MDPTWPGGGSLYSFRGGLGLLCILGGLLWILYLGGGGALWILYAPMDTVWPWGVLPWILYTVRGVLYTLRGPLWILYAPGGSLWHPGEGLYGTGGGGVPLWTPYISVRGG